MQVTISVAIFCISPIFFFFLFSALSHVFDCSTTALWQLYGPFVTALSHLHSSSITVQYSMQFDGVFKPISYNSMYRYTNYEQSGLNVISLISQLCKTPTVQEHCVIVTNLSPTFSIIEKT